MKNEKERKIMFNIKEELKKLPKEPRRIYYERHR